MYERNDLFVAFSLDSVRDYLAKEWPEQKCSPEEIIAKLNNREAAYVEFPPKQVDCTSIRAIPLLLREGINGQIDFCLAQLGREDLDGELRKKYEDLLEKLIKLKVKQ